MKKTYVKPEVYFESFKLSTSIATGCSASYDQNNTNFGDPRNCVLYYGTDTVFVAENTACNPIFDLNNFCYHVPSPNDRVFSS